jgi:TatD DNase family protein
MRVTDAHSHIHVIFHEFYSDFLNFTGSAGISSIFINSETPDETEIFSLIKNSTTKNSNSPKLLFFSALHPWNTEQPRNWQNILKKSLKTDRFLFIGETGLDRFRGAGIKTQKEIFKAHLKLAVEYNRPVSVHCVREWGSCIEVIKKVLSEKTEFPFIIHSFSGSYETMNELIKLGAYISFSATMILNKNTKTAENISRIDRKRILLETDFPYSAKDKNGNLKTFKSGSEAGEYYVRMLKDAYFRTACLMNISEDELYGVIEKNGKIFTDYPAYR